MAVPPQKSGQANFGLPAIAVGTQVHLPKLICPPQPFHLDVVLATLSPRPADLDFLRL